MMYWQALPNRSSAGVSNRPTVGKQVKVQEGNQPNHTPYHGEELRKGDVIHCRHDWGTTWLLLGRGYK